MLKNIEAIIFDLDGTLVDSMWMWKDIDIEYLKKYNLELPAELEDEIAGMSFTETSNLFKKRFQLPDSIEKIQAEWIEMAKYNYVNRTPLKPGVKKFIEYLRGNNIKMGIASSNSSELVREVLAAHELAGFFNAVHTSCEVAAGKPAPDVYLLVAKQLAVKPDKCLVFEDIPVGIMAGNSAGMKTCAIWDEFSVPQDDEKKELANYYIHSYDEVLNGTYEVLK